MFPAAFGRVGARQRLPGKLEPFTTEPPPGCDAIQGFFFCGHEVASSLIPFTNGSCAQREGPRRDIALPVRMPWRRLHGGIGGRFFCGHLQPTIRLCRGWSISLLRRRSVKAGSNRSPRSCGENVARHWATTFCRCGISSCTLPDRRALVGVFFASPFPPESNRSRSKGSRA